MSKKIFTTGIASMVAVLGLAVITPAVSADPVDLPASTSTSENDQNGKVSATSKAAVAIKDGYLTLEEVPDLNFGTTGSNSAAQTLGLLNNEAGSGSKNKSQIRVNDSRNSGTNGGLGWTLSAGLGNFNGSNASAWKMSLNNLQYFNTLKNTVNVAKQTLTSDNSSSATIISANANQGLGTTTIDYSKTGTNIASLDIPANTDNGNYQANITWTLNAAAPSNSTNGQGK